MTGDALELARKRKALTQVGAAAMLGLSQSMLSHMEAGKRNVSPEVARAAVALLGAPPTELPLTQRRDSEDELAQELGELGYPGFAHLSGPLRNPAEVLFDALDRSDLDVRVTEALPWLVLKYGSLDWDWLVREVKLRNRQNRLGFVVALAVRMGERLSKTPATPALKNVLRELEDARLAKEDTLCQDSWPPSRRKYVRSVRSGLAAHWSLDTRLSEVDLAHYAA